MADRQELKLVAFDLGGVLVQVEKSHLEIDFFEGPDFRKLTLGEISTHNFFSRLSAKTNRTPAWLKKEFLKIVRPHPFSHQVIASLRVPFTLWSNINLCHFQQLTKTCSILKHGVANALSYELGSQKPHPHFFTQSLWLAQVEPHKIIFFDDKKDNIEAANAFGIQTRLVNCPSQIPTLLRSLNLSSD